MADRFEVPSNETGPPSCETHGGLPLCPWISRGAVDRRGRLCVALFAGLALTSVLASIAVAAQPRGPACWGPTKVGCSSTVGPLGGNLNVSGTRPETIYRFVYAHKCLGMMDNLDNEVDVLTTIRVSKSGTFSYKGKGTLLGKPSRLIPVSFVGKFISATRATAKLSITYKSCRSVNLKLRYPDT